MYCLRRRLLTAAREQRQAIKWQRHRRRRTKLDLTFFLSVSVGKLSVALEEEDDGLVGGGGV